MRSPKNKVLSCVCALVLVLTTVITMASPFFRVLMFAVVKDSGIDMDDTERWVAGEANFKTPKSYSEPFYDVTFDFVFTHTDSGKTLKRPAFWNGGQKFNIRYALTELGEWTYIIDCSDKQNPLHGTGGTVNCTEYTGEHDIYKHGFIRTNGRYFTYADGTPFFYLGDTHWHMALENIDTEKNYLGVKATRFEYTLMRRKELGFTVIQSQPLGEYSEGDNSYFKKIYTERFSAGQLERFKQYDKYFELIAEMGFVHANAQLSYPVALGKAMKSISDEDLELLCRYWVARYGAYPVMWTLSQECDNDYYFERPNTESRFDAETNPWKKVAMYIDKYDAYSHPLTAHQENSEYTTATNSAFRDIDAHNWWAAQINYNWSNGTLFYIYEDYYNYGQYKPAVEYEGAYDHFWTGTNGARLQGWISFLNGMSGYGYGSQAIWSANTTPGIWAGAIQNSVHSGVDNLTREDIDITWLESLDLPAAKQLSYMKDYLTKHEWWTLTPCFDDTSYFSPYTFGGKYSAAHNGNQTYVAYFYNTDTATGAFYQMSPNTEYTCTWFNPITGEYEPSETRTTTVNGTLDIGDKPQGGDWVFSAVKTGVAQSNEAILDKLGCNSTVGAGSAMTLLILMTAVVVIRGFRFKV